MVCCCFMSFLWWWWLFVRFILLLLLSVWVYVCVCVCACCCCFCNIADLYSPDEVDLGGGGPCGGCGFPLSLYEWSFTTCLTLYNHKYVRR